MGLASSLKKAASKSLKALGGSVTIRKVTAGGDLDYVPTPKDRVVISSVVYQIVQINTEEQNNTPIAFTLFLRS